MKMKKYIPLPVTERVLKIKKQYMEMPVALETNPYLDRKYKCNRSGDRWMTLGFLRGWKKHADAQTTRLRTSLAEAEELYESLPVVTDDELLLGHLYLPELDGDEKEEYERLDEAYAMSSHTLIMRPPRKDHIGLDFDKLLRLGINGLISEIKESKASLSLSDTEVYPDYEVYKKHEFYDCMLIELEAVLDLEKRYVSYVRELAGKSEEPRKSELLYMADVLERVPANPAATFYEAIQSVQFFLSNLFGLYPLGRPDRYLYSYYKCDTESGVLTNELAQELIDNFCLHVSTRVFSRSACGFIVGGKDEGGNLVENELTYMFLTALDHIKMPDPNGALAVNEKTSDAILAYSADILSRGVTHPAFYNDGVIVTSLINNFNVQRKDAVNYIHSTCAEISIAGASKAHSTPFSPDLPRILFDTVKAHSDCDSFDKLFEDFISTLKQNAKATMHDYAMRMMEGARIGNEAMRICALVSDCVKRGKSIYEGGERYTFIQPNMIGFATALDSLVAIRELVYNENKLTLSQFCEILENNFVGSEALRLYIVNKLPHYGNDDAETDELAGVLAKRIKNIFKEPDMPFAKYMVTGTFSYVEHANKGAKMGATFDGRLANTAYSDGCCPVQGRDVLGPVAMLKSLTSWDQSEFLGGMVVNVKFSKKFLSDDFKDSFISFLRVFIERGGIEMQVNVINRETLIEARRSPEKYRSLTVRIGGYSDYFVRLSPALQDEIIARTQY